MITIFSYNPDKMMYQLHEFDNDSVDRYFDISSGVSVGLRVCLVGLT